MFTLDLLEAELEDVIVKKVLVKDLRNLKEEIKILKARPTLEPHNQEDLDSSTMFYNSITNLLDWYFTPTEKQQILEDLKEI